MENATGRIGFVAWALAAGLAFFTAWLAYFMLVPRIVNRSDGPHRAKAISDITALTQQVQDYRSEIGEYPVDLTDLVTKPAYLPKPWRGPYRNEPLPMDAWLNAYDYLLSADGESFSIISYGMDGAPGGTGRSTDISFTGTINNR